MFNLKKYQNLKFDYLKIIEINICFFYNLRIGNTAMSKNIEENVQQQSKKTVSQNENISFSEFTKDSSLKGGILYCKHISAKMEEEAKNWQKKLNSVKHKNKILRKSSIDLTNEKQQLVMKFHEELRKYGAIEKWYLLQS